jgi:pimeloyl-ACP methyl ester carboxylesterase
VALAQPAAAPPLRRISDTLRAFDGRRIPAELETLVLRDGSGPDSIDLEVTWLRLPATTAAPGSPIVFLMGGPGVPASVIGRVPPYFSLFDELRSTGDVILLDQRGTGLSRPELACDPVGPPPTDFLLTAAALERALVAAYAPCVAKWRGRNVPLDRFGPAAIAADLEAMRSALGADRISLLGFSYGTRLALEYARRHPDRVDRIVLQGVLGFDHGARLPADLDALLGRVAAVAAADPVASDLTPDLRSALAGRLAALERAPVEVPVPVPGTAGDTARLAVGREGMESLVSIGIGDTRIPALLASLGAGDQRVLAGYVGGIYRDLATGGGGLFGRTAYCAAPPSAARLAEAARAVSGATLGPSFDNRVVTPEFCRSIGLEPGTDGQPEGWDGRLGGTALLIQGELDDRTPLGNAEEVARGFGSATVVTVRNGGHELLPSDAVQALVTGFLSTGQTAVRSLDLPAPRFPSVDEAAAPRRRPGG